MRARKGGLLDWIPPGGKERKVGLQSIRPALAQAIGAINLLLAFLNWRGLVRVALRSEGGPGWRVRTCIPHRCFFVLLLLRR